MRIVIISELLLHVFASAESDSDIPAVLLMRKHTDRHTVGCNSETKLYWYELFLTHWS